MAAITEEVKLFMVQRLAMFDTLPQVVEAVKETFGVEVSRQQVHFYDPTIGKQPAKKWIKVFRKTRRLFLKRTSDIAIANKSVRLARLDRMQVATEGKKNFVLAAALLEQAAKEMGDAFTNRREITGKDGEPVLGKGDPLDELTTEELAERAMALAKRLAK